VNNFEDYNNEKEKIFTATGDKLFCHPKVLKKLRDEKIASPIVIHIMPTEICNLNCSFCSVANRAKYSDLPLELIKQVVNTLHKKGLKAVILSGGGEPLIYPQINELLEYLFSKGLEVGLITNGILLGRKLKPENLAKFTWIRISTNSLDSVPDIDIPYFDTNRTTFGFSYVWTSKSGKDIFDRIKTKIKELKERNMEVSYVRLVPDCNIPSEELLEAHRKLGEIAKELGKPFFHQPKKIHDTPEECHLGRVHPVLYTDGRIYPCDGNVLNSPLDDKRFHDDYSICNWDEIKNFYSKPFHGSLIDTSKCPHCVFKRNNDLLRGIINGEIQIPDKPVDLKHKNFI